MKQDKNKHTLLNQLKHDWCELDLACKSALIISLLLLVELIFNIFFDPLTNENSITSIFRTSLSSIFGYIFGMNTPHLVKKYMESQIDKSEITEKNETLSKSETKIHSQKEPSYLEGDGIRILFSTFVCMTCLIALFIANLTNHLSYSDGIIQVEHLVSTTIGFLISGVNHHQ